jgi:hypothetical protein
MEPSQLDDIANEIESLHKPMKNVIEIVFTASPILALSTHGWSMSLNSMNLLKVGFYLFLLVQFLNDGVDFQHTRQRTP